MNIILLSGGSGKRLWPLSNDIRSKQFIKIFRDRDGGYESMLQRVYRQICAAVNDVAVTIATSKAQVSAIHNQLGDKVGICVEPCRRDTFPAVALAASWLHEIKKIPDDEPVVVCPVDSYAGEDFFLLLKRMGEAAQNSKSGLILMGISPTYPSEKYGYMMPLDSGKVSKVLHYKEKPDAITAEELIGRGALWNGGVFAFRLGYFLKKAHELINFETYEDLYEKYNSLESMSLDYAVTEQEKELKVIRFNGGWKDLGTWNTLTEAMGDSTVGNAILNESCENVHVINELDVPVLCMGIKNAVVSASPEGILVSDKEQSSYIKPYVDQINQQVMFADKSWGQFRVLDIEDGSMTVKVTIKPGSRMNYHSHENRDEVWTILSGEGRTVVDGMEQPVTSGDVITMQAGCRHTIIAESELEVIEVQLGREISVHDKKKYELGD